MGMIRTYQQLWCVIIDCGYEDVPSPEDAEDRFVARRSKSPPLLDLARHKWQSIFNKIYPER